MTSPRPLSARISFALAALALVVASVLAYWPTFRAPFVFDDLTSIVDNPSIRRWDTALRPPSGTGTTVDARPILNLSFTIDHAIGGLEVLPYRVTNFSIHLGVGLLLFVLVRATLTGTSPSPLPPPLVAHAELAALGAAGLWLLHPLATAAVSYASRRVETLFALLFLATVLASLRAFRATRSARVAWTLAATTTCALGMGTKETMALAPIVVVLFDAAFVAGSVGRALRTHTVLHLALASTWIVLAILLLQTGDRGGTVGFGSGIAWHEYALTQVLAVTRYAWLVVWPYPLVFDHGTIVIRDWGEIAPRSVALLALVVGTFLLWRKQPRAGFLALVAWLFLAPSSSVLPIATQTVAEHRMYAPLGALVTLATLLAVQRFGAKAGIAVAAACVAATVATHMRNRVYASEISLWADTAHKVPSNARAHDALARALIRTDRIDDAVAAYARAVELAPSDGEMRSNYGNALLAAGRRVEALRELQAAVDLAPESFAVRANLGLALLTLDRAREAKIQLMLAHDRAPDRPDVSYALATAHVRLGESERALSILEHTLEADPDHLEARWTLANLLARSGELHAAVPHFEQVLEARPTHVGALNNLANARMMLGEPAAAVPHYRAALAIEPSAMTHANLGIALLRSGNEQEALSQLRTALSLDPGYEPARRALERAAVRDR
ncbi:hypothetical protein ASA1KI_18560 [Opitutales bacterium ASA1]|uniref:tetratricopeptide repeat protein n=1 Tax=Congregicoccus parvus TaxID=3081749 RepID=UPI002B2F317D|nr:hypothetical protein ASA1KI_18560 [Opitutales bacterium ASA1]